MLWVTWSPTFIRSPSEPAMRYGRGHLYPQFRCRATFAEASFCLGQRKIPVDARTQTRKSPPEQFFIKIKLHATHFRKVIYRNSLRRNLINAHPPFLKGGEHENSSNGPGYRCHPWFDDSGRAGPAQARS